MVGLLSYRGYTGIVEVDFEDDTLHGRVIDIKDVVTFQGKTPTEIRRAFEASVDDYLEFCADLNQEPDRPFSGKFQFRTTPELHRLIALAAMGQGKSMNEWMNGAIAKALAAEVPDLSTEIIAG